MEKVHAGYGRTPALFGVSLHVERGEIVALLGRNGVGKTTTLRTIVGLTTRTGGRIALDGTPIERQSTHAIARMGVAFVPEDRGVFPGLTVGDNLRLGRLAAGGRSADEVDAVARFPVLGERLGQDANALSGGERQMLAIGRALLARPRLLLLDEFSEGLQPNIVQELGGRVAGDRQQRRRHPARRAECTARFARQRALLCAGERRVVDEGPSATFLTDDERLRKHLVV